MELELYHIYLFKKLKIYKNDLSFSFLASVLQLGVLRIITGSRFPYPGNNQQNRNGRAKNDEQKIPHFYHLEMTQIGEMRCEESKQLEALHCKNFLSHYPASVKDHYECN